MLATAFAPVVTILPVTLIVPVVIKLPPVMLPLAETDAGVNDPTIREPLAIMLPPVMLPEAEIPVVPSNDNAILKSLLYLVC
jgi:hypothetical protein